MQFLFFSFLCTKLSVSDNHIDKIRTRERNLRFQVLPDFDIFHNLPPRNLYTKLHTLTTFKGSESMASEQLVRVQTQQKLTVFAISPIAVFCSFLL
ncbi:hypothetical protein V6N13_055452 [Hibiscus sabdariffa]|uniref:Uncharacterized protein n=1 Tax=Hibiscus sabdariffa TaxID=183260 RepID=A0ABR2NU55_9ROSI